MSHCPATRVCVARALAKLTHETPIAFSGSVGSSEVAATLLREARRSALRLRGHSRRGDRLPFVACSYVCASRLHAILVGQGTHIALDDVMASGKHARRRVGC